MTQNEFFIFLVIGFIVSRLPVIGKYFRSVYTMYHENGHSTMALLMGGKIHRIDLFANTEGVATTSSRFWLARVLTSFAGYPFASFVAFLFFYFLLQEQYQVLFYGLAITAALNLLLWVRNLYGIIWLVSLIGLLAGLHYLGDEQIIEYSLLFIGSILLSESIAAAMGILVLSIKQPLDAGDASSLRKSTWVSARIWGLVFFLQSLWFGTEILKLIV